MISFPQLFQALKTLPATVRFLNDTFNQKDQIAPFDDAEQGVSTNIGPSTKSTCFKQLGLDDHSSRLPVKKLDAVPVLVDEDVHIAIPQVKGHPVVHDSREHMEALSHVGRLREQPVPHAVVKTKHGSSPHT